MRRIKDVTRLLIDAADKESENLLIQRWILHYQNDMTFQDFKNKLAANKEEMARQEINSNLTEKEIMQEVEETLNSYRGGGEHRNI